MCEALFGTADPFPNAPGLWEALKSDPGKERHFKGDGCVPPKHTANGGTVMRRASEPRRCRQHEWECSCCGRDPLLCGATMVRCWVCGWWGYWNPDGTYTATSPPITKGGDAP